ncbi:MAG: succinate dehydrogenase cytochrome b subunit [Nitriliruptorales bacterium]
MATPTPTAAEGTDATRRMPMQSPERLRRATWLLELYRSALGKKYVMAVTGIYLMAWITGHVIGNFKIFLSAESFDHYSEWLRVGLGVPILPETVTLWIIRILLIVAFALHIHAAYALTVINRRARPDAYESKRDYVAADFAARTMRWTGVIVGLYVLFHLADLTWGYVNPAFEHGEVYNNTVSSLQRWPVALFYILATLALAYHLYHGAWSLFQSLGINKPRFNHWRRIFAIAFAAFIAVGFISVPAAVWAGVVS